MSNPQERTPLLDENGGAQAQGSAEPVDTEYLELRAKHEKTRAYLASGLLFLFILAVVIAAVVIGDGLPKDPLKAAIAILERSPVIVSNEQFTLLISLAS